MAYFTVIALPTFWHGAPVSSTLALMASVATLLIQPGIQKTVLREETNWRSDGDPANTPSGLTQKF
jgi:hypothetical protein